MGHQSALWRREQPLPRHPLIAETGALAYNGSITSGGATNWDADAGNQNIRAAASYITGSHNLKVGYQGAFLNEGDYFYSNNQRLNYAYNSPAGATAPVPSTVAITYPVYADERTSFYGIYVQDQWTINRFTVQGALRSTMPGAGSQRSVSTRTSSCRTRSASARKPDGPRA